MHNTLVEVLISFSIFICFDSNEKDNHHQIERLLDRKSPLFRYPHGLLDNEQKDLQSTYNTFERLNENLDKIRLYLDVKTLYEYYNVSQACTHLLSQQQQQQYANSTENLSMRPTNDGSSFTDLNMRESKRSIHRVIQTFKIDYALVNRIQLNWPILFTHIITRLKSSIIYHLITLRFEFQANSSSSLTDPERLVLGKLIELLTSCFSEKQ
ncbi:unnamed protein product [Rotaria magnacalcarata]|uniref:Uncharacterized protein n=2 Tax=Rotaria magnacalcarata TaxID=392030 RepID=A0A814I3S7_9BILA|nr:unnamed protein product [Rotaria magnacalcarata]CAF1614238.1 unnamed protein product [Rotaria magnacalcarata]CAF2093737.1 unnamed protein product [Rotaria magnacalcarata]